MEHFQKNDAMALIKAAIDSKAITLRGPVENTTAQVAGTEDALYLKTLLTELVKQTP